MKLTLVKAVLFDLDGVLVSTDEQHYRAWKALADSLNIPFDRASNNRFRGVSRMACMDIMEELSGRRITPEEKLRYATWKNDRYRALLTELTPGDLDPAVRATLDALRKDGLLLAVGSSSKNAKYILERIGLGGFFDAISDGTNITRSKPDPEVFETAARMLGVPAEACLVVEDAEAGIRAAKAGKMLACAIGDARRSGLADYEIEQLSDLIALLKKESETK